MTQHDDTTMGAGPPAPARRMTPRRWITLGAVAVAAVLGGAFALGSVLSSGGDPRAEQRRLEGVTQPISAQDLADRYGLRVNLVGVVADGGMVDLRFTVLDQKKARKLFTDSHVVPTVIAESDGTVMRPPHQGHHAQIIPRTGASYFVLMGNIGGAVQRGVPVSVLFNKVRVEHVTARA